MWTDYDVIIIGGGPAGLSAGIYTSRAGLHTLLLEKGGIGGELMNRELIENYPGFGEGNTGPGTRIRHGAADDELWGGIRGW